MRVIGLPWKSVCSITLKTASCFHFVSSSNASWIVSSAVALAWRSLIASIFSTTRLDASRKCCSVRSFFAMPFGMLSILKSWFQCSCVKASPLTNLRYGTFFLSRSISEWRKRTTTSMSRPLRASPHLTRQSSITYSLSRIAIQSSAASSAISAANFSYKPHELTVLLISSTSPSSSGKEGSGMSKCLHSFLMVSFVLRSSWNSLSHPLTSSSICAAVSLSLSPDASGLEPFQRPANLTHSVEKSLIRFSIIPLSLSFCSSTVFSWALSRNSSSSHILDRPLRLSI
mmetsp:Transcript_26319/g.63842  ORF Transcript_26319/g.63842 Transcript_26319/m.63842 type:complete len:286 (+) Transcript_26319:10255-11112(+)